MRFRYRLRTLLLLLTFVPPLIGFWPTIKRRSMARVAQISASDVVVVAAAASLIAARVLIDRDGGTSAADAVEKV